MNVPQERTPNWAWGAIVAAFFIGRCSVDEAKVVPDVTRPAPIAFTAPAAEATEASDGTDQAVTDVDTVTTDREDGSGEIAQAEPARYEAPVYYANCSAARAAGAAPVYVDDPGYAPHLDRDHDGVGCE